MGNATTRTDTQVICEMVRSITGVECPTLADLFDAADKVGTVPSQMVTCSYVVPLPA